MWPLERTQGKKLTTDDAQRTQHYHNSSLAQVSSKCWLPGFSPFPTMFSRGFFSWLLKVGVVWQRIKSMTKTEIVTEWQTLAK